MLEGRCINCGETVVMEDENDDVHGHSELLGTECGGLIEFMGSWELNA